MLKKQRNNGNQFRSCFHLPAKEKKKREKIILNRFVTLLLDIKLFKFRKLHPGITTPLFLVSNEIRAKWNYRQMVTRFNMETARAVLYRKIVVQGCNLPRATEQPHPSSKTTISPPVGYIKLAPRTKIEPTSIRHLRIDNSSSRRIISRIKFPGWIGPRTLSRSFQIP